MSPSNPSVHRSAFAAAVGGVLCLGLVGGLVSPAWADDTGAAPSAPLVGGFGLGDQLEAMIDERDGAVRLGVAAGGLQLSWDSRRAGVDRYGFGYGWDLGLASVDVAGAIRVFPASGGMFEMDASQPTGLRGYGTHDLVFRAETGELPAIEQSVRAGLPPGVGDAPEAYAYVLDELGGVRTFLNEAGDPVAQSGPAGQGSRWFWSDETPHRLVATTDADGVATVLDWDGNGGVLVAPAVNVGGVEAQLQRAWRITRSEAGLEVVDPTGGRSVVTRDASGLATSLSGPSGAETLLSWGASTDGVARIAELTTTDGAGAVVSERTWAQTVGTSSGWPVHEPTSGGAGPGFETTLSDGSTTVRSVYGAFGLLTERHTEVATPSGGRTVQSQTHAYPGEKVASLDELPPHWNRPTRSEVTHVDAGGGSRTTVTEFTFDELGRAIRQVAPDGAVTETWYDPVDRVDGEAGGRAVEATGGRLIGGLPIRERVTAPDGLVTETRHELTPMRTAVAVTETYAGVAGSEGSATEAASESPEQLVRTARTEFEVGADGFVSEQREFPQGGAGEPVVTTFEKATDLGAGTTAVAETVVAGDDVMSTRTVTSLVHGQTLKQTDVTGRTVSAEYDALGRVVEQVDAGGNVTKTAYETEQRDGRNATTVIGPDLVATTEERDALGRPVRVFDNIDRGEPVEGHVRVVERREYEGAGTVRLTDAWGATTTTTQDALGRAVATTAPGGLTEVTEYDDVAGTVTRGLTPTGDLADAEAVAVEQQDVLGRVTATEGRRADGEPVAATAVAFDGIGRVASETDGRVQTTYEPDAFGNPATTRVSPADGTAVPVVAERRFDGRGASLQKTLTVDGASRSGYGATTDALGRIVSQTDQANRSTVYTYTADGLVATVEHPDGRVTTNTYDDATRQLVRTETTRLDGQSVASERELDPVTGRVLAMWDPADPAGSTIRYGYDALGNVTEVVYPDGARIEHAYDEHGRRVSTRDVAGLVTSFTYDEAGLMVGAAQVDDDGEPVAGVAYVHDDHGRVIELVRDNGVTTRVSYTSASQIATETTMLGEAVQSERSYAYDERRNVTRRTETVHSADAVPVTTVTVHAYDAFDRLTGTTVREGDDEHAPIAQETAYALNVSGDITEETVTTSPGTQDAQTTVRRFDYDPTGELRALTTVASDGTETIDEPVYDNAGNLLVAVDGRRYEYDAMNRAVAETGADGATTRVSYWADGSRRQLEQTVDGTAASSTFYWDGETLLNDRHSSTTAELEVASYLSGTARHARTVSAVDPADPAQVTAATDAPGTTSYLTTDRHANVTELTAADGAVHTSYAYTDYGVTIETRADGSRPEAGVIGDAHRNPFRYAGQHTDPSGTQHLAIRTYDAKVARFTQVDPTDLFNRHFYADANPISKFDPSGRTAIDDAVNGFTLAFGTLMGAFSVGAAIFTGGASLGLLGSIGIVAEATAVVNSTLLLVNDHAKQFMPKNVREGLMYADYGLVGISVVTALVSRVPDLVNEFRKRAADKLAEQELSAFIKTLDDEITLLLSERRKNVDALQWSEVWKFFGQTERSRAARVTLSNMDTQFAGLERSQKSLGAGLRGKNPDLIKMTVSNYAQGIEASVRSIRENLIEQLGTLNRSQAGDLLRGELDRVFPATATLHPKLDELARQRLHEVTVSGTLSKTLVSGK